MSKSVPLIVRPLSKEEFATTFSRRDMKRSESYFIIERMKQRTGPGDNSFLLVLMDSTWVIWGIDRTPSLNWYLTDTDHFMTSRNQFEFILKCIASEEFYLAFESQEDSVSSSIYKR